MYLCTSTLLEQIVYFTEKGASGDGRGVAGDPGPQVGALLGHGAGDGAPLHLPLVVHNHAGVILKISICSLIFRPTPTRNSGSHINPIHNQRV